MSVIFVPNNYSNFLTANLVSGGVRNNFVAIVIEHVLTCLDFFQFVIIVVVKGVDI